MLCACAQEQERRRKAEVAAHSALNGPRVRAYEFAGPDFEVRCTEEQSPHYAELAVCGEVFSHTLVSGELLSTAR